ncbi:hypothetical protein ZIOFF_050994 [Zingiber officinale]|uniref:Uncharacterized protein n=1 Tax=Zingiber officinale TaxID=94328 RepID=A0A8J5FHZ7_ZINOF|nr:hypothetical protein ZIOFF_050994 [Zingiber officinale]
MISSLNCCATQVHPRSEEGIRAQFPWSWTVVIGAGFLVVIGVPEGCLSLPWPNTGLPPPIPSAQTQQPLGVVSVGKGLPIQRSSCSSSSYLGVSATNSDNGYLQLANFGSCHICCDQPERFSVENNQFSGPFPKEGIRAQFRWSWIVVIDAGFLVVIGVPEGCLSLPWLNTGLPPPIPSAQTQQSLGVVSVGKGLLIQRSSCSSSNYLGVLATNFGNGYLRLANSSGCHICSDQPERFGIENNQFSGPFPSQLRGFKD